MEASSGSPGSPAPFLLKTYEMVDDPLTSSAVSWCHTGHSFIVWNPPAFARDLLPKYFKHSNFSSFIRQLNTYGFRKVDPDQWEFANLEFIRGQKHLLKNIHRRKPIHSHSVSQLSSSPVNDSERAEFEEEIERLKQDKISLESQLEKYKIENQGYRNQLRLLAQALLNTDQGQPYFMEQPEGPSKKRRLIGYDQVNPLQDSTILSSFGVEDVYKADSLLEKFFPGIIHHIPPGAKNREMAAELAVSSGDSDLNVKPCTPECHSSALASHSCPSIHSPEISSIKPAENGSIPPLQPGANDVFWEQFLSEAPVSSLSQVVVHSHVKNSTT